MIKSPHHNRKSAVFYRFLKLARLRASFTTLFAGAPKLTFMQYAALDAKGSKQTFVARQRKGAPN
jgi:hypothetical protein